MTAAVFDGHTDALLWHWRESGGEPASFLAGDGRAHVDLPRARAGSLCGGLFALWVPSPEPPRICAPGDGGWRMPDAVRIDQRHAEAFTKDLLAYAWDIVEASCGAVRLIDSAAALRDVLHSDALGVVLHLEGAEAVRADLSNLDWLVRNGVRSIGPVWSRPNAFGTGVPFAHPGWPDDGPGLTAAGRALVRACNERRILVDLAHLTEAGFWDVAAIATAPLVCSHTAAHALSAFSRNLTDAQLDAVGRSGGLVGVSFDCCAVGDHASTPASTSAADVARHVTYVAERIGVEHVAVGSDFDGAEVPHDLSDVAALGALRRELAAAGFEAADVVKILSENWIRVLEATWQ